MIRNQQHIYRETSGARRELKQFLASVETKKSSLSSDMLNLVLSSGGPLSNGPPLTHRPRSFCFELPRICDMNIPGSLLTIALCFALLPYCGAQGMWLFRILSVVIVNERNCCFQSSVANAFNPPTAVVTRFVETPRHVNAYQTLRRLTSTAYKVCHQYKREKAK